MSDKVRILRYDRHVKLKNEREGRWKGITGQIIKGLGTSRGAICEVSSDTFILFTGNWEPCVAMIRYDICVYMLAL